MPSRGGRRLAIRWAQRPAAGVAVRIFTGAVVPKGHDTVVMQEDVRVAHGGMAATVVAIPAGLKRGANVRKAGEDVKAGEIVLEAGAVLRPQDLAALASLGFGEVDCFRAARRRSSRRATRCDAAARRRTWRRGTCIDANAPMLAAAGRERRGRWQPTSACFPTTWRR